MSRLLVWEMGDMPLGRTRRRAHSEEENAPDVSGTCRMTPISGGLGTERERDQCRYTVIAA